MTSFDEALWDHLVEHHGADRAQVRTPAPPPTGRRPVVVGIAATGLAAAGVATVLATGSHPASTATGGAGAGGAGGSSVDTAYIVKRVKTKVADEVRHSHTAARDAEYASGEVSSDGTLTLGPQTYQDSSYTAPNGVRYDHVIWFHTNGSSVNWMSGSSETIAFVVTDPVVNGKQFSSETSIDPANHTYTRFQRDESVPGAGTASTDLGPGLSSSPSQVQQALQNGQVTLLGTPMFNGTRAIALSITSPHYRYILYVDPQTYEPVGQAFISDHVVKGLSGVDISYWQPATPANIAKASDDSVPAGYRKVGEPSGNSGSGNSGNSGTVTR